MSNRKHNWLTVKFIFGNKVRNIFITPTLAFLLITLLAVSCWFGGVLYMRHLSAYRSNIEQLEERNQQYRTALALKEREREQMLTLAEDRFDELCAQIENQDAKIDNINDKVGGKHRRTSMKGSRCGSRVAALDLKLKYCNLINSIENREVDIDNLKTAVNDYRIRLERERALERQKREQLARSTTPSGWPTKGEITSDFGWRIHPIFGYGRFHSGLDIAWDSGTNIIATAAGRVSYSGWMQGYGYAVIIDHGHGIQTLYGHCSALKVNVGQYVNKGQSIAAMGSTGNSTGPHLHYEVRRHGECVNPVAYL